MEEINKNLDFKSLIKERNLPVTIFEELPDIDLRSKKRNMIGELSPDPATDFPTISSVNMSNPYMEQTPEKLGFKDKTANFDELRKEVLNTVPNFSKINELPKKSEIKTNNIETSFFSEKIFVRELDYYYTNSISRSSKTMSECRQIRQKIKKDGTNN